VDEINLLASVLSGTSPTHFNAPDLTSPEGVIPLSLVSVERLDDDLVNLLYRVIRVK
jgi:hypothetical protein